MKLENGEWIFDVEMVAKSLGITTNTNGTEYVRWKRVNEYLKNLPHVAKGDFIPEPKKDQLIGELKPRADYTDRILKNKGLVTITQIAKDYRMSGTKMNDLLHELHVQFKQSAQWLLYSDHHGKGYTHSETIPITRSDGRTDIRMNTKWTQKGRLFLYELLKREGILPSIEQISES